MKRFICLGHSILNRSKDTIVWKYQFEVVKLQNGFNKRQDRPTSRKIGSGLKDRLFWTFSPCGILMTYLKVSLHEFFQREYQPSPLILPYIFFNLKNENFILISKNANQLETPECSPKILNSKILHYKKVMFLKIIVGQDFCSYLRLA
jgi:hypothetical protein